MATTTVKQIIELFETIAPLNLAEKWDNAGLQIGDSNWPVNRVWVALEPELKVVKSACDDKANLLITHHPLIFSGLKKIDFSTPLGQILQIATLHQLAIFSAHTNYDSVHNGLNDVLAKMIGLKPERILAAPVVEKQYKLVVFIPKEHETQMLEALFHTTAGTIGAYRNCSFRVAGIGTFKPDITANPYIGEKGDISTVDEIKLEVLVDETDLKKVVEHIRQHHPYETMAYDVYPVLPTSVNIRQGIGRIGKLDKPITLQELALDIKNKLGLSTLRIAGNPEMPVKKIALCTGSGGSLIDDFLSSDAQVYLSGDFKYHDARKIEAENRGLIDIGHFDSERIMIESIARKLKTLFLSNKLDIEVIACNIESDPFIMI